MTSRFCKHYFVIDKESGVHSFCIHCNLSQTEYRYMQLAEQTKKSEIEKSRANNQHVFDKKSSTIEKTKDDTD
jgi:hypothetical protein